MILEILVGGYIGFNVFSKVLSKIDDRQRITIANNCLYVYNKLTFNGRRDSCGYYYYDDDYDSDF